MVIHPSLCLFVVCACSVASLGGMIPPDSKPLPRAWASSLENDLLRADLVADGNTNSRWSSAFADHQWLVIDLHEERRFEAMTVHWNTAGAARYSIEASSDGIEYRTIFERERVIEGDTEQIALASPVSARFLRFMLHERSTGWGFSIQEILLDGRSLAEEDLPTPPPDAVYRDADRPARERAADAVSRMSLREKIHMLSGRDMFYFPENTRLGLRRIFFADASMGLRLPGSTAFPALIGLAATFDPELAMRYGDAVGEESRSKGVHVLLGPGVNLYRVPQGGRNFEYLGEDPFLASRLVVPYIRGVQERGVMATIKHYVANNHEWHRKASNSVVDERTLRELYMPAFEAAIREADVAAVMTAYNLINGEYAAQNPALVKDILRDEWGFDGLVMTDWWSVFDSLKVIKSGVGLEMPHGDYLHEPVIRDLLAAGLVSTDEIDEMVESNLRPFFEYGFYDRDQTNPDALGFGGWHNDVSLETARGGMVLARNEGGFLPIDPDRPARVVLLGKNARETETSGYGAARVEPTNPISILDSFRDAAGQGVIIDQFDDMTAAARDAVRRADAVFVSVSTREREANDRAFELDQTQRDLIESALAQSDKVAVLVTAGSGIDMGPWVDRTRAVLMAWFGGNVGNQAVGEIVFGRINPSGKMPFSLERRWEDAAAYGHFLPHDATFNDEPIWGRERAIFPVVYEEGLFMGYRHFDQAGIEPLFAFGHGLSYTDFTFEDLVIERGPAGSAHPLVVRCIVRNVGARAGAEVAQLYIGQADASVQRPVRELKGFEKVSLEPGQATTVEFAVTERDLSYFDTNSRSWRFEPGRFMVYVGSSSRVLPLSDEVILD
jgi:beta-glucosidase